MGSIPIARSVFPALAAALALAACRGTVPERNVPPDQAFSAVLIGGRALLPGGEARDGMVHVTLESVDPHGETYRLAVRIGQDDLYLVEPGAYRLAPPRSLLGSKKWEMTLTLDGRRYYAPFPEELARRAPIQARPARITALGTLEARVTSPTEPVRVRLDDGIAARRRIVQASIRDMMDPSRSTRVRESAIAWSRALQNNLLELQAEEEARRPGPAVKP